MTNVLIPTDFSVNSLQVINHVAQSISGKMSFVLFHAFEMPESLIDAKMKSGSNGHSSLITEELRMKCRQIKTLNPNISAISFKIMYGNSVAAFQNFAEANDINTIFLPADYQYIPIVRESVNPLRMFKKSGIDFIQYINTDIETSRLITDKIAYSKLQRIALQ